MSERHRAGTDSGEEGAGRYRYAPEGALPRPRWIGRGVRLLLGLWCLSLAAQIVTGADGIVWEGALAHSRAWWFVIAIALYVFPDVLNIGWGIRIPRRRLLGVLAAVGAAAAGAGWLVAGSPVAWPLGGLVWAWTLYTFGHLGAAFVVATLLATPGCEMRSLPELWARLRGRPTREHYCPGFISAIDRLEARLLGGPRG
ncbi:MAG: hypothetical protein D6701_13555 [Gemmatimonadetes bacterium]|nr:MAG: hypothetical protein D6701_13555 [Gemmatimonadota bacterium]